MNKVIIILILVLCSCSSNEKTQEVFTDERNYYDYEYYGEDISELDTFEGLYDYYYYDVRDRQAQEYEPVELEQIPSPPGDAWYFEDY